MDIHPSGTHVMIPSLTDGSAADVDHQKQSAWRRAEPIPEGSSDGLDRGYAHAARSSPVIRLALPYSNDKACYSQLKLPPSLLDRMKSALNLHVAFPPQLQQ